MLDHIDGEMSKISRTSMDPIKTVEFLNSPVNQSHIEEDVEENNFDTFILEHFDPYTGKQEINSWLDETEKKFNNLRISRSLRFEAISFLLEGEAKRKYIKNRKDIKSFDDFYEFLLSNFDMNNFPSSSSKPQQTTIHNTSNQKATDLSDNTNFTHRPPAFRSTAIVDFSATNTTGETLADKSTKVVMDTSTIILDQTTSDLRRAILGNLINNPKVFKGGGAKRM